MRPTHFDPSFRPNIKLRSSRAIKKVIPSHPIPSHSPVLSCSRVKLSFLHSNASTITAPSSALPIPSIPLHQPNPSATFQSSPIRRSTRQPRKGEGEVGRRASANRAVSTEPSRRPTPTPKEARRPSGQETSVRFGSGGRTHTLTLSSTTAILFVMIPPPPASPTVGPKRKNHKRSVARYRRRRTGGKKKKKAGRKKEKKTKDKVGYTLTERQQ